MSTDFFMRGMKIAHSLDVSTPENSVVIYSISFQPTRQNRDNAFAFVKSNPGAMMIEHTECGAKLVEMGFESCKMLGQEEIMTIWSEASRRFIMAASGNVTAFVDGADKRSVFRTVELPNILQNPKIRTINGEDKNLFAKRFL